MVTMWLKGPVVRYGFTSWIREGPEVVFHHKWLAKLSIN